MTKRSVAQSGDQFGDFTLLERLPNDNNHRPIWKVECKCGEFREKRLDNLTSGDTVSCGCRKKERGRVRFTTHGKSSSPEYQARLGMIQRCYNANSEEYHNYGGRDITVCDRWRESFENFYADMGDRPSKKHSLDRRDVNGNYSKENCRWATLKEQMDNRRKTRKFTIDGITKPLVDWCQEHGKEYQTVLCRLKVGKSIEDALTTPVRYNVRWHA